MPVPVAFAAGLAAFHLYFAAVACLACFPGRQPAGFKTNSGQEFAAFHCRFHPHFVAMGAGASTVGQCLRQYRHILMPIAGTVIIIFGLQMLGYLTWALPGSAGCRLPSAARREDTSSWGLSGLGLDSCKVFSWAQSSCWPAAWILCFRDDAVAGLFLVLPYLFRHWPCPEEY